MLVEGRITGQCLNHCCAHTRLGHKLWTVNYVILVEGRVTGQCLNHCCAHTKLGHKLWTVNCVIFVEGRVTGQCISHCCANAKLGYCGRVQFACQCFRPSSWTQMLFRHSPGLLLQSLLSENSQCHNQTWLICVLFKTQITGNVQVGLCQQVVYLQHRYTILVIHRHTILVILC